MSAVDSNDLPPFVVEALDDAASSEEAKQALGLLDPSDVQAPLVGDILARISEEPHRYAPFYERVAQMFSLDESKVEELLRPGGWKRAPLPGIQFKEANDHLANPDQVATLVRFDPGLKYPRHRHAHPERVLLLEGGYTDSDGTHYEAGDVHEMQPGSVHGFVVDPEGPCIAATVADRRLEFTSIFLKTLARLIGR